MKENQWINSLAKQKIQFIDYKRSGQRQYIHKKNILNERNACEVITTTTINIMTKTRGRADNFVLRSWYLNRFGKGLYCPPNYQA